MSESTVAGLRREGSEAFPALQFDPQEFMHFVEDHDLTEAQANQLLQAVWSIMVAFVDLGFRIHPVQQAVGDSATLAQILVADSGAVLGSSREFTDTSNEFAAAREVAVERQDS